MKNQSFFTKVAVGAVLGGAVMLSSGLAWAADSVVPNWQSRTGSGGLAGHAPISGGESLDIAPALIVGDPIGDTIGSGVPQTDISFVQAYADGANLNITLQFATSVSPYTSGLPDALGGEISLDTDQNPATGILALTDIFCPQPSGMGADYLVDLFDYNPVLGQVPVYDSSFSFVGGATAAFGANYVEVTVPLALLGGDDGIADLTTVIGTIPEPTDCAPNGGVMTSDLRVPQAVPALQGWAIGVFAALMSGLGLLAARRRRC